MPRPRLCHLKKWPNFPGYGFNLHERLKQPGHLIGSVDPGSPAEATSLRVDDKIIEVNGRNMLECSHHQVVDKIRQFSDRVSLLVVDATTDRYYREQSIWIHSKMPNIEEIECPSSNDKGNLELICMFSSSVKCGLLMNTITYLEIKFSVHNCI